MTIRTQMQAQVLAKYKPTLNVTVLVSHLRGTENTMARALERFKSTRHMVQYYEDIVTNRTVGDLTSSSHDLCVSF